MALLAATAACSSDPVLDEHLAGWQSQHDAQTHAFAHDNFALSRQADAEAGTLARSGVLEWRHYAEPLLATATRSRAVHQAQGRAVVLERFLAHMRGDPGVDSTEAWFAREIELVRAAADEAGAGTAAVSRGFGQAQAMSEDTFRRVATAAAREGTVRGEALELADLRRTAGNYFRRRGFDKRTLAFDRDDAAAPVPDERLVADVERHLGWAGLRQVILEPRTCVRPETVVMCAPAAPGTAPPLVAPEELEAEPPPERSFLPGENLRWSEPRLRAPDLLKRRPGW